MNLAAADVEPTLSVLLDWSAGPVVEDAAPVARYVVYRDRAATTTPVDRPTYPDTVTPESALLFGFVAAAPETSGESNHVSAKVPLPLLSQARLEGCVRSSLHKWSPIESLINSQEAVAVLLAISRPFVRSDSCDLRFQIYRLLERLQHGATLI